MTNGQPLVVRAAKKPISTLRKPLESVNLATKESESAEYERSDVCAVPAASIVGEAMVAIDSRPVAASINGRPRVALFASDVPAARSELVRLPRNQ